MGRLVVLGLPRHLAIGLVEREQRLPRASGVHKDQVAVHDGRGGVVPGNDFAAELFDQVVLPDDYSVRRIQTSQDLVRAEKIYAVSVHRRGRAWDGTVPSGASCP